MNEKPREAFERSSQSALTLAEQQSTYQHCDVTMLTLKHPLNILCNSIQTYSYFKAFAYFWYCRGVYVYKFGHILSMRFSDFDTHTCSYRNGTWCQVVFHLRNAIAYKTLNKPQNNVKHLLFRRAVIFLMVRGKQIACCATKNISLLCCLMNIQYQTKFARRRIVCCDCSVFFCYKIHKNGLKLFVHEEKSFISTFIFIE